jgi:hypothetical protein
LQKQPVWRLMIDTLLLSEKDRNLKLPDSCSSGSRIEI